MRALIVALALAVALVAIAKAEDTTTGPKDTFFGVDRNDDEAVKAKHEELADEQFKKMFGDDQEMPDFSGAFDPEPAKFTEKIRETVKKFSELFTKKIPSTTTPQPVGDL